MAMIRRYGQFPAVFVPDEGEVVRVARSPAGPFLEAAVTTVRRTAEGFIRVVFVYVESGTLHNGKTVKPGDKGNVYIRRDDDVPLIRRASSGQGGNAP